MKLLLVNDDGYFAPGMSTLIESVRDYGEITVIAPDGEQSGMSQAITVHQPLRLTEMEAGYILDGTPTDCVKMGLEGLKLRPDFVLSGINCGSNLSTDVLYSGTVGAALEAVILGVPAVAFSLCGSAEFMPTASQVVKTLLVEQPGILFQPQILPPGGILNVNIPALPLEQIKGVRLTKLGVRKFDEVLQKREHPRGGFYYWLDRRRAEDHLQDPAIDLVAVQQGYISITPLRFDLTSQEELERLSQFFA